MLTTHREPSHAPADTVGGTEARAERLTPRRNSTPKREGTTEARGKRLTQRRTTSWLGFALALAGFCRAQIGTRFSERGLDANSFGKV